MHTHSVAKKLLVYCVTLLLSVQPSWPLPQQIAIPAAETARPAASIPGQSITMLANGNWLLLGGESKNGPIKTAVIFDPRTATKTVLASELTFARSWHTATLLPDGTVLVFGGQNKTGGVVPQAELLDSASLTFRTITVSLAPRTHHSATLLTDGRVLVTGGIDGTGNSLNAVELWDSRTNTTTLLDAQLPSSRRDDQVALLADGTALLWGGSDDESQLLSYAEVYDPGLRRFLATTTYQTQIPDLNLPSLEASLPEDGAVNVPLNAIVSLRFSKLLRPETVASSSVSFRGPSGPILAMVIPAANGRLVFVTPKTQLAPATKYTVTIQSGRDQQNLAVIGKTISFTTLDTSGSKDSSSNSDPSAAGLAPLHAPPGITAVAGQTLQLNGVALKNVTLKVDNKSVRTDRTGRFLLAGVSAGHHALEIDGRTASVPGRTYGVFEAGVDLQSGKTLALPYVIWMTELDTAHAVHVQFPTTSEVVLTNPLLPGLEFHIPPHTVITDIDGKIAQQISITPIRISQPPFPLPAVQVPIYFTIQPGGGYIQVNDTSGSKTGARLVYPNAFHNPPGTLFDFWNYNPDTPTGWFIYGQGRVSPNGLSVLPNPGVQIYELTGAMVGSSSSGPGQGRPPGGHPPSAGEPVDLSTGEFIYDPTDIYLPDVIPISLTRTYRQGDTASRSFGMGTTSGYDMWVSGNLNDFSYIEIVLPDGGRVRFDRTAGNLWNSSSLQCVSTPGPFFGATFAPYTGSWVVTLRNGTVLHFLAPPNGTGATPKNTALSSITDRNGNTVTLTHDSNYNVTQITSPNGRWIQLTYDGSNRVTVAQDNIGRTVHYLYDSNGRLYNVTDVNGGTWIYGYDPTNVDQMTSLTDARQIQYLQNQYDSNGRVKKQILADSTFYTFSYTLDSNNNVTQTTVTDPSGNIQQYTFFPPQGYASGFQSGGYLSGSTYAVGKPEQERFVYTRDSANFIRSVTDSLGREADYSYDALGNLNTVTRLAGTPEAVTTSVSYEPGFSRITSVTDPLQHTVVLGHDNHGNTTSVMDALGNASTFAYNSEGQMVSASDPTGSAWQLAYSGPDLTGVTDPLGNTTSVVTDGGGRTIEVTDPLRNSTQFQYNAFNLLTQQTDALGGVTTVQYDADGEVLSVTDARNIQNPTTYSYNNMNRLQSRTDPLGHQATFGYDNNGNLTCSTDRRGRASVFGYDGLNRTTSSKFGASNCTGPSFESTISYGYDAGDRLTSIVDSLAGSITPVFDSLDRLMSETSSLGSISYGYDAASRPTSLAVAGQPSVNYSYDSADRLTQISRSGSNIGFGYDPDGRRTSLTLPNGVSVAYGYDAASDLVSLSYQNGTTSLGQINYSYDQVGRLTQTGGSYARTGLPAAVSSAAYDADNRLTSWGGNSSYSYDANGNLIGDGSNTYTWSGRNQLASISGGLTASFQYDPFGRRVSKSIGGVATGFLYAGFNAVQELSATSPTANLLTGDIDEIFTRTDSTGRASFLSDALGSTIALTDNTGTGSTQYTYEPFGNTSASGLPSSNPSQYTGRENDSAGLYFYRFRYYNAQLQRFISEDPIGFAGRTTNLYEYAYASPTNYKDPLGLQVVFLELDPFYIDPDLLSQAQRVAAPKNSLPMPDGGRIDLAGRSHFDPSTQQPVPTPHVHDPLPPFDEPYQNIPRGLSRVPRRATPDDVMKAIQHNSRPMLPLGGRSPSTPKSQPVQDPCVNSRLVTCA